MPPLLSFVDAVADDCSAVLASFFFEAVVFFVRPVEAEFDFLSAVDFLVVFFLVRLAAVFFLPLTFFVRIEVALAFFFAAFFFAIFVT